MGNGWFLVGAAFTLAACGQSREEAARPAEDTIAAIAPGTYSDAPSEGDGQGWRITLAEGERSTSAAVAHCTPDCPDPVTIPLRAGMGGLMAEYQSVDGRAISLAIRPHGNGVEIAADWGEGLESHKLARVE
jgi:hypothetical protein